MTRDKRRVQTAVIGGPDSELPVVLPLDAVELDAFRRRHPEDTYWCGVWLGGCGQRLTARRCTECVCHFAHLSHADNCRRSALGVSSADHLYIKQDLLRWLADQNNDATAEIEAAADGNMAGAVRFTPQRGAGLRVLLSADSAQIADRSPSHILLAEDLAATVEAVLARHGYVNLVRCVPDGPRRRTQIGTKTRSGQTWHELNECALTPEGTSTPSVEAVRRQRTASHLLGRRTPATPPPTTPAVVGGAVNDPQGYDRTEVIQALEDALADGRNVTKLRLCLERAETATRSGANLRENGLIRAAGDALLRMERGVGVRPSPVSQRSATKTRAARSSSPGRALPPGRFTSPMPRRVEPTAADQEARRAAADRAAKETTARATILEQERAAKIRDGVAAVRGALRKKAREGTTSSWGKLRDQIGPVPLASLKAEDQANVLYEVDRNTPSNEPLLSTLLALGDPALIPAFRRAASRFGIDLPEDPHDLRDVLEADAQALYELWRHR
ncbi:competence protein CoiA family protein [Streptomyces corynorhini]|uniref:Uncharacterized protein n=1 Tax=Streptomyces corynorhini TaxID=2282652 RepID=A0A370BIJ0_9ACTN|nr:competence protein CoiA family protein [Streptomyces corynorhini]RDG40094.1 hypothetical protein DVH02_00075 [Streptomyces corynorhini]